MLLCIPVRVISTGVDSRHPAGIVNEYLSGFKDPYSFISDVYCGVYITVDYCSTLRATVCPYIERHLLAVSATTAQLGGRIPLIYLDFLLLCIIRIDTHLSGVNDLHRNTSFQPLIEET